MKIHATATYQGQPLAVLQELIAKRSELLGVSAKKSTVATAIQTLRSIRATTRDATKTKKFDIQIQDTGWKCGFSNTDRKYCVRAGILPTSPKVDMGDERVVWIPQGKLANNPIFKVVPPIPTKKPYYIAAPNLATAFRYELNATKHRIDERGKLAKNALGVAMGKLWCSANLEGNNISKSIASNITDVIQQDSGVGGTYHITIVDNLDYATDALNGGEGALDTALMKAANKIASTINHFAGSELENIAIPFPEIRTRG